MIVRFDRMMSDFEGLMNEINSFIGVDSNADLNKEIEETAEKQRLFVSKHEYNLSKFGITEEQIKTLFSLGISDFISKPLLINQLFIWEEEENIASIAQKSFPGRIKCFRGILVPPNKAFRESKINDFPEPESPVMIFKPFLKLISIISIKAIFSIFSCINI